MKFTIRSLLSSAIIYGFGGYASRLLSLLLLPLFTRFLTPTDYGVAATILQISVMLTSIFSAGIGSVLGVPYFERASAAHRLSVVWTGLLLMLASALLMVIVGCAFAAMLSALFLGTPRYGTLVVLGTIATAFTIVCVPLNRYLQLAQRPWYLGTVTALGTVCNSLLAAYFVAVRHDGAYGLIDSTLVAQAVTLALLLLPLYRYGPRRLDTAVLVILQRLRLTDGAR